MRALKILYYIFGFLISFVIIFIGFLLTNYWEDEFGIVMAFISVPIFGFYFLKFRQKQIGMGMLISFIPLILLALVFIILSRLH